MSMFGIQEACQNVVNLALSAHVELLTYQNGAGTEENRSTRIFQAICVMESGVVMAKHVQWDPDQARFNENTKHGQDVWVMKEYIPKVELFTSIVSDINKRLKYVHIKEGVRRTSLIASRATQYRKRLVMKNISVGEESKVS
ncbi:hypothetical protein Bca4012_064015 [Brassica carinata]|uniref:Uncharacterized protein n=1 Tax=Brassica carinata TaxID=52824 RepID=A0A8X7Q337_BRACI|nr:hypothetical protein Bca52824_068127 [Brassica carinata]